MSSIDILSYKQSGKDILLMQNLEEYSPVLNKINEQQSFPSETHETLRFPRHKLKLVSGQQLTSFEVSTIGQSGRQVHLLTQLQAEVQEIQERFEKNLRFLKNHLQRNRKLIQYVQNLEGQKEMKKTKKELEFSNNCKIW